MNKVIVTLAALGLATVMAADVQAGPFGWFRRGRRVYAQPAPATARVEQGYRAFSYEPAAPAVRYQAPAQRMRGGGHAYESATNKALGRVN